jgi:hypothetical protein
MTKLYIDTLLIFQIFFISRPKFSFFVNFPASVLGTLSAKGTAVSITSAVLFCLSMGALSGLLESTAVSGLLQSASVSGLLQSNAVSVMTDLSQYKTLLLISALVVVCIYSMAQYFCQEAYNLW